MNRTALFITAYGLTVSVATFLGGLLVSGRRLGQAALRYLIALGAGFMLAAIFLEIIPATVELWQGEAARPMLWVLGGYLLIQLVEHTIAPHFHFGEETHEEAMMANHAALAGLGALLLHALFDGVTIAVTTLVSHELGALIFVAVLLHKLPEGFTVASMMLAGGWGRRGSLVAALLVGIATMAGVVLVLLFQDFAVHSRPLMAHVLPLAAGVTLYVAASDLIPEVNTREGGLKTSLMVFAGVAMLYFARLFLEAVGVGHGH